MSGDSNVDFGTRGTPMGKGGGDALGGLAAIVVVVIVVGVILINRGQEEIRKGGGASPVVIIKPRKGVANRGVATGEHVAELAGKAEMLFMDPGQVWMRAESARDAIRAAGQDADAIEIVEGGVYLAEHSRRTDEPTYRPSFSDYSGRYTQMRSGGKTHDEAIAELYELEKF